MEDDAVVEGEELNRGERGGFFVSALQTVMCGECGVLGSQVSTYFVKDCGGG